MKKQYKVFVLNYPTNLNDEQFINLIKSGEGKEYSLKEFETECNRFGLPENVEVRILKVLS